jgi:hypothetical protein
MDIPEWTVAAVAVAIITVLMLTGCGTMQPRVTEFPNLGFNVVEAPRTNIDYICVCETKDDGTPCTNWDSFPGCWDPETRNLWIDWYLSSTRAFQTFLHELCHADGSYTDKECLKMFRPDW